MSNTKSKLKRAVKKVVPIGLDRKITALDEKVNIIYEKINKIDESMSNHDFRIDELKDKVKHVEPYQPIYGIEGIIDTPARDTQDRAEIVYKELENNVKGTKILDIGSSLGYVPFYFSERGAITEGWDFNPKNVEISNLVKQINGSQANFYCKELNKNTVEDISNNSYDVVTIFNVFHHIIASKGLLEAQQVISKLTELVPLIFVELAQKGEDKTLFWDEYLPKNDLDLFRLCKNIDVVKVGEFNTHLSNKRRPLYKITRNNIKVNSNHYPVDSIKRQAYKYANVGLQRTYFKNSNKGYFIKKYNFNLGDEENRKQIINEINFLLQAKSIKNIPRLLDFELKADSAALVLNNINGDLIFECNNINHNKATRDLIKILHEIEEIGFFHNDIRSWNVLYDGNTSKVHLIDFGMAAPVQNENNMISLMWAIWGMLKQHKESPEVNKLNLPNKKDFLSNPFLLKIYKEIENNRNIKFKDLVKIKNGL